MWEDFTMSNGQERKKFKRKEKPYMARFRIRSDEAQKTESDDWDSVILENVSAGGASFFYNKDLGIGTLLDLKIYLSKAILIINCVGKIVRSHKSKSTSMFCFAIKFVDIGEKEEAMINASVEEDVEYESQTSLPTASI